jgi:hypothetical protein
MKNTARTSRHCGGERPDPRLCESWLAIVHGALDEFPLPCEVPAAVLSCSVRAKLLETAGRVARTQFLYLGIF